MIRLKSIIATLLLLSLSFFASAQDSSAQSGVGAFMRSNERAYVVIAVMLTILIGVFIYLARLDRKIGKMEKES